MAKVLTLLTAVIVLSTAMLGYMQIQQNDAVEDIHVLVNNNFTELKTENKVLSNRVGELIRELREMRKEKPVEELPPPVPSQEAREEAKER